MTDINVRLQVSLPAEAEAASGLILSKIADSNLFMAPIEKHFFCERTRIRAQAEQ